MLIVRLLLFFAIGAIVVFEPADLWQRELPASLKSKGFSVRWNADTRQEEVSEPRLQDYYKALEDIRALLTLSDSRCSSRTG